jgi:hypothetical protein
MELEATIEEADGQSILVGLATVIVNGKFAQFGGRMMVQVSDVILRQFVDNFIAKAQALSGSDVTHSADTGANESHSETANELNGLAVCWVLLKSWFGGLFGKKPAS